MYWSLIIVIFCVNYQTLDASSVPCDIVALSIKGIQYFKIQITFIFKFLFTDLDQFSGTMLTFLDNVLPAYTDLANDVTQKVKEFKPMNGNYFLSLI